jgi:serine/threonine-protein kinase
MRVDGDPDHAMLLDFGVAKLMQGAAVSDRSRFALTQAGMVFGTPEYMSPEQACGHPLDGRSDLYSLAATMFAMLTGCALFEGKTAIELLTHHARTPPPHLATLVPELAQYDKLDELLQRCLAKKREQRPASAEELDQLLAQLEVYVARAGKSNKSMKVTQLAASSFFEALPSEMVDPGKTLMPADFVPPERTFKVGTLGPDDSPPVSRRRGLYLALGGIAVLGMVAVTIAIAMSKKSRSEAAPPPSDAATKVVATTTPDAAAIDGPAIEPPLDAGPAMPIDAALSVPVRHDGGARIVSPPKTNEHLKAAEEAMKQGNRLRQLAEADLALQADPRSARAKYLLADALIKGGDLDRGCAYLRELGRNPLALARASAAKCPP